MADLARAVQEAAAAGDAVALELVRQAAQDLAAHVRALVPHFAGASAVPVALAGGLVRGQQPVRRAVLRLLTEDVPEVCVNESVVEPPRGALLLASRLR